MIKTIFFHDNTPLIIDQPEDNLDNQYIYKNLLNSLKQIKNSRQIIIVTHSSTIVTNADVEQVIVLESDNKNGWVEKKGYPDNDTITRHIINYLEGGANSFHHKIGMYSKVLHYVKCRNKNNYYILTWLFLFFIRTILVQLVEFYP